MGGVQSVFVGLQTRVKGHRQASNPIQACPFPCALPPHPDPNSTAHSMAQRTLTTMPTLATVLRSVRYVPPAEGGDCTAVFIWQHQALLLNIRRQGVEGASNSEGNKAHAIK
jgi:hypothetical protein